MSEDAQQHEPILNFQRMYCTVCLFLQAELSEIHTDKRSEEALMTLAGEGIFLLWALTSMNVNVCDVYTIRL